MLNDHEVIQALIDGGLLAPGPVIDGHVRVVDVSRRNAGCKVISQSGPSFLVKRGTNEERARAVAYEAALYHLFEDAEACAPLRPYLPRLCGVDPARGLLVLQLITDGQPLAELPPRSRFSRQVARALGEALGTLHGIRLPEGAGCPIALAHHLPAIHRPTPAMLRELSAGNLQVISVIQQDPTFFRLLDEAEGLWQGGSLTHGDIKGDNWLVSLTPGQKPIVRLVDWEFAGLGDPCWDVGSVFADYLSHWLLSIPAGRQEGPDMLGEARYPLSRIQPAVAAFWHTYRRRMKLAGDQAREWLDRAVRFCAARLVQTALERTQGTVELTAGAVLLLQVSLNILQRPAEAAVQLLGIEGGLAP